MESNQCFSSGLWHVCYVEPRVELPLVKEINKDLGYEAYAPVERIKHTCRGRRVEVERPIFPRFVFAQVDPYREEWQRLLDVDGVIDVLRNNNRPSRVPAAWIVAMKKAEELGIFDRTKVTPNKFKIGETVRVSDGPFAGFNAMIEEFIARVRSASASKRARVLVQMMGRMTALEIDIMSLEKL